MKTIMNKLITIKIIPVLTLVLLVVLVSFFVKGTAQDPEPGSVYLADDPVTNSIVKKLQGTITLYLTEEMVDVEADIAAIEDVLNQYALAMKAGDLDLWMSLYTDDTIKLAPDGPAAFGKEELRAMMQPLFDNFIFEEMDIFDVEIRLAGDYAFTRCNFTVTMTPKAGGESLYMDAKDLCIYQRQADGSWKIYWDCWNSNVPPPTG